MPRILGCMNGRISVNMNFDEEIANGRLGQCFVCPFANMKATCFRCSIEMGDFATQRQTGSGLEPATEGEVATPVTPQSKSVRP